MTPDSEVSQDVAVTGLVNIYHAITSETCERYVALGMATSAVSALMSERDALRQRVEFLKGRFEHWFKLAMAARYDNVQQAKVICELRATNCIAGRWPYYSAAH